MGLSTSYIRLDFAASVARLVIGADNDPLEIGIAGLVASLRSRP